MHIDHNIRDTAQSEYSIIWLHVSVLDFLLSLGAWGVRAYMPADILSQNQVYNYSIENEPQLFSFSITLT